MLRRRHARAPIAWRATHTTGPTVAAPWDLAMTGAVTAPDRRVTEALSSMTEEPFLGNPQRIAAGQRPINLHRVMTDAPTMPTPAEPYPADLPIRVPGAPVAPGEHDHTAPSEASHEHNRP